MTFIALLFICASSVLAAPDQGGKNHLTVGVPTDRCPVFYLDRETNEIVGIGADLMRMAAKEAGYEVTFRSIEEETLKDALDNRAYDVIVPFGSAISSATGQPSIVSENLFQTPFTLVTVNNRAHPGLNELHVGMLRSLAGAAETVSQLYPGIKVTFYETMDESVKALETGKVDALLHNSYVWSYVLQKPSYSELAVQPGTVFSMDFRVGTLDTPEGREIIDRLNEGLAKLTDTKRQAVILDYTARRLYQYDLSDYLYMYGFVLLLGFLLFVLLIVIFVQRAWAHRLEQQEKLRRLTDYDQLTGIFNLNGFRKKVVELLHAYPDTPYIMAYANIRNFKFINDSLGMEAGDDLLRFWADLSIKRLSDMDAVARIEADHFAVFRHYGENDQLTNYDAAVIQPISDFFLKKGKGIRVQVCTGLYALSANDRQNVNVDHMLDRARVAEKRLRSKHKDGFEFYNQDQWKTGQLMAEVAGHLNAAIETGEIQVWYQPQVNYETGKIIGAEALSRWNHPKRGFISPADFIPALEEAGLVYDLDCFVWEQVCKDLKNWKEQGRHQSVSVNLSRADIMKNQNVPELFRDLIQKYGLTPDQLRIEITETAYVENPELLISMTQKFREYGFQVEMDDFGSGYSSLNMLKEVQVDRIKLDLHFLTETGDVEKGRIIVGHMIQMALSLGMDLIAEGVEKEEQAEFLKSLGCVEMQGFYFHKPMPAEEFDKIMTSCHD